jgi:predicted transcriptional regulator of viral defense system
MGIFIQIGYNISIKLNKGYFIEMKFVEISQKLSKLMLFDQKQLKLFDPNFDDKQFFDWQKNNLIKKVIRGKYILADQEIDDSFRYFVSSQIYKPSYISMELAMANYGLIPETINNVTCISTKKTQKFFTPIGNFFYRHLKPSLFWGYQLVSVRGVFYPLAEIEKVILDYLYLHSDIAEHNDFIDMRIDLFLMSEIVNIDKLKFYLEKFENKSLSQRVSNLIRSVQNV